MKGNVGTVTVEDDTYEGGTREAVVMWVIETDGERSRVMLDNGAKAWVLTADIKPL
jgi:hypothetical protein